MLCFVLLGCGIFPTTPQGRLDAATKNLTNPSRGKERLYDLDRAAWASLEVGKTEDARRYAKDLLIIAAKNRGDLNNYGDAIHDGNLILGHIDLKEGRTEDAKGYLIESGKTPGSPALNSFGPNMGLARDLLEKGERDVVLQYFDLCRKFWELGHPQLDYWSKVVKADRIPDFGANLIY